MHWVRKFLLHARVIKLLCLFMPASQALSTPTCNTVYGNPARIDCAVALAKLPRDTTARYFVEQQMRTALPAANWIPFTDSRGQYLQPVSQLPKWWSRGKSIFIHSQISSSTPADGFTDREVGTCNVLIMGYFDSRHVQMASSAVSSWYSLLVAGYRIVSGCLRTGQGGGWIVQDGR